MFILVLISITLTSSLRSMWWRKTCSLLFTVNSSTVWTRSEWTWTRLSLTLILRAWSSMSVAWDRGRVPTCLRQILLNVLRTLRNAVSVLVSNSFVFAQILKQNNNRLENRTQLVTMCHMGPKVFINCAGFIKIDTASLGDRLVSREDLRHT